MASHHLVCSRLQQLQHNKLKICKNFVLHLSAHYRTLATCKHINQMPQGVAEKARLGLG